MDKAQEKIGEYLRSIEIHQDSVFDKPYLSPASIKQVADQILALIVPKDRPPLLHTVEDFEPFRNTQKVAYGDVTVTEVGYDLAGIVQAQWDKCVKHYEEGK